MHSFPSHKRILLISFRWCPQGGVGTRRWSKFAKYLSRLGTRIEVIHAEYPYQDPINWCDDVRDNALIRTHPTPAAYPARLRRPQRDLITKAGSRVLRRLTHPVDPAQHWGKYVKRRFARLIKSVEQPPGAVILTVPVFSPLIAFAELATEYPHLRFIVDYRDPWTYYLDGYGLVDTSRNRRLIALERSALLSIDSVWVTTEEHRASYQQRFPELSGKIEVLHNGYDPEEHGDAPVVHEDNMDAICPGTIIRERFETLRSLLMALHQFDDPVLKERFRIRIYSNTPPSRDQLSGAERQAYDRYVRIHAVVSPAKMALLMRQARFGLVLHDHNYKLTVPIKIYDFLGAGNTILYLGPSTSVSRQLAMAGHGCAEDSVEAITALLARLLTLHPRPRPQRELQKQYAIPALTDRLVQLLSLADGSER